MPSCPSGHASTTDDYCDVCGARIAGPPAAVPVTVAPARPAVAEPAGAAPAVPLAVPPVPSDADGADGADARAGGEVCPGCGTARTGRFCEDCGHDFVAGTGRPESTPGAWTAVVTADRAYFDSVVAREGPDAAAMTFPPYRPELRVPLTGERVRIGRRSRSRGTTPEIDLAGPPEDPGVSHLHAVLVARPDGTWAVVDPGSTNGTTLNGAAEPVAVNVAVPVSDGDRIHVGAWTTITLRPAG
jgi:hypothetical protein